MIFRRIKRDLKTGGWRYLLQAQRLSEKDGSLIKVWHDVCMSNGFKLIEVVKINRELSRLKEGEQQELSI